jgi:hypothetical protein
MDRRDLHDVGVLAETRRLQVEIDKLVHGDENACN